jgi:hemoglobin
MTKTLLMATVIALAALPAHAADDRLYRALGEQAGLAAAMGDFVDRLKADPQIGPFFQDVARKHLVTQLTDQLCELSGGPCRYEGETMKKSHEGLKIGSGDFNRLVEVLQDTLDARGVPFATQRELLARLAPMHRDVITRP